MSIMALSLIACTYCFHYKNFNFNPLVDTPPFRSLLYPSEIFYSFIQKRKGVPRISPSEGVAANNSFEEGGGEESVLNSAEKEILYNIVTDTVRGDRGKCHNVYPFH